MEAPHFLSRSVAA